MILAFKDKFKDGKATNFDLKIARGLIDSGIVEKNYTIDIKPEIKAKIHTIREDVNNRWKAGQIINFYYNVRTKNMRKIAPDIPCIGIQTIKIAWLNEFHVWVSVDGNPIGSAFMVKNCMDGLTTHDPELIRLIINDGFDNVPDFFKWFNEDFVGKIIHWTGITYKGGN